MVTLKPTYLNPSCYIYAVIACMKNPIFCRMIEEKYLINITVQPQNLLGIT